VVPARVSADAAKGRALICGERTVSVTEIGGLISTVILVRWTGTRGMSRPKRHHLYPVLCPQPVLLNLHLKKLVMMQGHRRQVLHVRQGLLPLQLLRPRQRQLPLQQLPKATIQRIRPYALL